MEFLKAKLNEFGIELSGFQLEQFELYRKYLIAANEQFNLTSITDPEDIELLHFADSISIIPFLLNDKKDIENIADYFNDKTLIDVGTGAGFPGIPIKIIFPKIKLTLVDSLNKRVKFLNETCAMLGLEGVECVHSRAEDLGRNKIYRDKYDWAVARALAPLNILCEYCMPFVKPKGLFVAMKSKFKDEINESENAIKKLGGKFLSANEYYLDDDNLFRSVLLIEKIKATPKEYPRKAGTPKKNPL